MTAPAVHGVSPTALGVLTTLLEARTGQRLGSDRAWRLESALRPLLRAQGFETLDDLALRLLRGGGGEALAEQVADALVNNETSFFRDPAVFDMVVDAVAATTAGGGRRRIWSAGCSTGQEPLSLAIALAERCADGGTAMPEIIATDVSEAALTRARAGRYTQFEIQRGLPTRRMLRWFEGQADGDWTVDPALLRMVSFRRLNLAVQPWAIGGCDLVLCRNVLLYLARPAKAAVFAGLAAALRPGGLLVLGAGETVLGQTSLFEPSRTVRGAYQVVPAARVAA